MWNLYGIKGDNDRRIVATFGSEQQLLAYVSWATLRRNEDGTFKFEQKTPLTGCVKYDYSRASRDELIDVPYNPTPSML